jgi:thioredoxin-related protein
MRRKFWITVIARVLFAATCAVIVLSMSNIVVEAAELVMFESPGCPWCARWRAEVGPAYSRSEEGRRAPLRNVALIHEPDFHLDSPVTVSPTFVLVDDGREVGRIVGYPGPDFFWGLLDGLMKKLSPTAVKN